MLINKIIINETQRSYIDFKQNYVIRIVLVLFNQNHTYIVLENIAFYQQLRYKNFSPEPMVVLSLQIKDTYLSQNLYF